MNFPRNFRAVTGLKLELFASFAGTGWAGMVQVLCIPAFIKLMGIESYGLVGFYLVLQAMLQILDLGLSPTMNREMARYSVQPDKRGEARDLVRTLEIGYWLIGLLIGAGILVISPWLAAHWIKPGAMPVRRVAQAIILMGGLALFQWPVSFYQGGLMGLRQQVVLNALKIIAATLSNVGAVLILWWVSPTIKAFLLWQVGISIGLVLALARSLWRSLPPSETPARINLNLVRNVRTFAAGMTGIAITSLILTQADRVFVSKVFNLKIFGYYSLAWSVAACPLILSGCVFSVLFPRMSALVATGDRNAISQAYHRGSQLMAVLILPVSSVLASFSFEVLRLWTRNSETAANTSEILTVLMIGSALNALLYLPYMLQLAYGWTKLPFAAGVISISLIVPLIFPLTKHFGPVGAASIWAIVNVLNLLIAVPIMHRRLLSHDVWGYFSDIGRPLLCTTAITTIARFAFTKPESSLSTVAVLAGVWALSLLSAVIAAPQVRTALREHLSKLIPSYA
ncbi:MAG TPA: oligosaccharide flippase family protein [Candidatus Sulfotelmatobacter sp.]|nr:oligosaccharide flippase family protein [Candidatus Sulfotelmatobacter sp.]